MKLLLRLAAGSLAALLATSILHAAGGAAEEPFPRSIRSSHAC